MFYCQLVGIRSRAMNYVNLVLLENTSFISVGKRKYTICTKYRRTEVCDIAYIFGKFFIQIKSFLKKNLSDKLKQLLRFVDKF